MAVPDARVHLKMAHGALPALLPTPTKWKMLPVFPTTCVAAILPKPLTKTSRADSDERWDAHKTKPQAASTGRGCGSSGKNATSPPPKPGRADAVERWWDAHKKAASPTSSSSSSRTSSLTNSSKYKVPISRATSAERWDVHKKHRPLPQPQAKPLDDGESSSTASNDIDDDMEDEEIVWKPRALYAGPGFAAAAPEPSMIPMPTSFLVPVA